MKLQVRMATNRPKKREALPAWEGPHLSGARSLAGQPIPGTASQIPGPSAY